MRQEFNRIATGLTPTQLYSATQIFAILALFGVLHIGLLAALIAGFLIYQLIQFSTPLFGRIGFVPHIGKAITLIIIVSVIIAIIYLSVVGFTSLLTHGPESLVVLMQKMADAMDTAISHLPLWAQNYVPLNVEDWQDGAAEWLRANANHLSHFGRGVGEFLIHILFGMVIGGMVAFCHGALPTRSRGPLTQLMIERVEILNNAFRRIVFSQFRISLLNTLFTSIFLVGILPLFGIHLPLTKTMIVVTFIAGLLPVVGNLISNTVIVLLSLSVSPTAAIASLVFLVIIHKLEYFMNARIIGSQIRAHAWEILLSMLVMESCFGVPGLIAAPIYYAYIKEELSVRGLI